MALGPAVSTERGDSPMPAQQGLQDLCRGPSSTVHWVRPAASGCSLSTLLNRYSGRLKQKQQAHGPSCSGFRGGISLQVAMRLAASERIGEAETAGVCVPCVSFALLASWLCSNSHKSNLALNPHCHALPAFWERGGERKACWMWPWESQTLLLAVIFHA